MDFYISRGSSQSKIDSISCSGYQVQLVKKNVKAQKYYISESWKTCGTTQPYFDLPSCGEICRRELQNHGIATAVVVMITDGSI